MAPDSSADAVLNAYADEIAEMKRRGGYVTADVIDVNPATPNLDAMLAKLRQGAHARRGRSALYSCRPRDFLSEHQTGGSPRSRSVLATCCGCRAAPRTGSRCAKTAASAPFAGFRTRPGWTPHYTGSGVDQGYQPLCFGPAYLGPRAATGIRYDWTPKHARRSASIPARCGGHGRAAFAGLRTALSLMRGRTLRGSCISTGRARVSSAI